MFNKKEIIKRIKVFEGADLEIRLDREKGVWYSAIAGKVLAKGRAYSCNCCGVNVIDNDFSNNLRICLDCIKNIKGQIEPKKECSCGHKEENKTNDGRWVDPNKKYKERKSDKRSSVGNAIKFFNRYKVEIVVPTIQEYLDVMAGMTSISRNYPKKRVLALLDMCAKGMTRKEISKATGLNDHTIYCTMLDFRKVNLVTTKDNVRFQIVPPYHYITNKGE